MKLVSQHGFEAFGFHKSYKITTFHSSRLIHAFYPLIRFLPSRPGSPPPPPFICVILVRLFGFYPNRDDGIVYI